MGEQRERREVFIGHKLIMTHHIIPNVLPALQTQALRWRARREKKDNTLPLSKPALSSSLGHCSPLPIEGSNLLISPWLISVVTVHSGTAKEVAPISVY